MLQLLQHNHVLKKLNGHRKEIAFEMRQRLVSEILRQSHQCKSFFNIGSIIVLASWIHS